MVLRATGIVALAATLAYWTWYWFAPSPAPRSPLRGVPPIDVTAASGWFGLPPHGTASAQPSQLNIKLVGVFATAANGGGHALVQVEGRKTVLVRPGEYLTEGVRLREVHANHVIIDAGGTPQHIPFMRSSTGSRREGAKP